MPTFLQQLLRRIESRALILVIGAAGGFWAFFNIASEMTEGETQAIDKRILLALRNPANPSEPIGSYSFQEAMRDVTALGGVTVMTLVTIVGVLAFLMHGRRWHAAILAGTVLLADISSEGLKNLYGRPRPALVPHGAYVYSASFPSGHSTLSAATFLTLATLIASLEPNRGTKIMVYVLAVLLVLGIGVSRVYLGVHWPSDVLAGWCLGAAWALAAWTVLSRCPGRQALPDRD
ncbi:MAG: putative phosphatidylglycerophosphatase [Phenylobacterium sp.]|jgi:undecaprenyl-diphosphatase|uniref:phosphatase PAP2 family protein n=1 Tax=Phenylobacterium sp. TaxID=1871053 RepID=UPI00260F10D6|nr:phosphatase PAP2 family protein [Phenylobacterium sp.]MDB5426843.1 putative phosphatidylglycerophosphatase [Phenylobacterium sp.]MDB5462180.1 putative phosphatidylglycerophosphatase [Phenylobacterium sp.]MDB5499287.1 putative phosphatidylglycerophosphatase [Phenylobacterium sp.]